MPRAAAASGTHPRPRPPDRPATNDGLARAQVLDRDAGHAARRRCSTRRTSDRSRSSKRSASGEAGSMSGPSTTSAPAQRIEPSGCGSPATGQGARRRSPPAAPRRTPPRAASGSPRRSAESAKAALCTCSRLFGVVDQVVPLGVGDERDLLAERGRRDRARPVRALTADVRRGGRGGEGRRVRRALAAEVEQVRALPRGEHALHDRAGRDAERLAERARLRTLRQLARARLLVGVDDVAHALARDRRSAAGRPRT